MKLLLSITCSEAITFYYFNNFLLCSYAFEWRHARQAKHLSLTDFGWMYDGDDVLYPVKHTAPVLSKNFNLQSSCHNEDEDVGDSFESSENRSSFNDSDSSTESTDSESDSE